MLAGYVVRFTGMNLILLIFFLFCSPINSKGQITSAGTLPDNILQQMPFLDPTVYMVDAKENNGRGGYFVFKMKKDVLLSTISNQIATQARASMSPCWWGGGYDVDCNVSGLATIGGFHLNTSYTSSIVQNNYLAVEHQDFMHGNLHKHWDGTIDEKDFIRAYVHFRLSFQKILGKLNMIKAATTDASIVNQDCNCWLMYCFCPGSEGAISVPPYSENTVIDFDLLNPILSSTKSIRITSDDTFYYVYFILGS